LRSVKSMVSGVHETCGTKRVPRAFADLSASM
jgi:hypothetical protein